MAEYDNIAEDYIKKRLDKTKLDSNRDIEAPAMFNLLGDVKNKRILDMGCGFGDRANILIKKGAKEYIGFDLSKALIDYAKALNIPKCKFSVGDMSKKLPYPDKSFDVVFSSLAIHYIPNLKQLFSEVRRVLKPKGIFVFSTQHPIYNVLNTTKSGEIYIKHVNGKRVVSGNYFDESLRDYSMGKLIGHVKLYPYTFETIIKTILNTNFEIIDYKDAKPIPSSKKYDPNKFMVVSTLPTFILFKLRKK